jgi:hypothetical protein
LLNRVEVCLGAVDEGAVAVEDQGVEGSFLEGKAMVIVRTAGSPSLFLRKVLETDTLAWYLWMTIAVQSPGRFLLMVLRIASPG